MKTIIAGSREIQELVDGEITNAFELVSQIIEDSGINITEVISGKAIGIDTIGEAWASLYNIPVKSFPAKWKKFGRSAGIIRNGEMAKYGEGLIAIRSNKSSGTTDMINQATKNGLNIYFADVVLNLDNYTWEIISTGTIVGNK